MNRRSFLSGILLACAAPAIVRADSLMRIVPMDAPILLGDYDVMIEAGPSYSAALDDAISEFTRLVIEPAMRAVNDRMERDFLMAARGDTLRIRLPNSYLRTRA